MFLVFLSMGKYCLCIILAEKPLASNNPWNAELQNHAKLKPTFQLHYQENLASDDEQ